MTTYLEAVNDVLARLRENSVATVTATSYSTLIGKYINDAKRQVEDAWTWDALQNTITVTTSAGVSNYVVTGSGIRQKDIDVNDITNKAKVSNVPIKWIVDQQQLSTVQNGPPIYYAWNGTNGTDSKVELYPTPDGIYSIKFNMCIPQATLSNDATVITVPSEPIVQFAYARAIAERGEDQGITSNDAYLLAKGIISDYIALEASRFVENLTWEAV